MWLVARIRAKFFCRLPVNEVFWFNFSSSLAQMIQEAQCRYEVFFNSLLLMPTWDAARKLRFIFSTGVLSKANNHLVASKLDSQSMVDHIHKVVWSMKLKIYLYWNLIRSQLWLAEFWLYFALIFSLLSISFCEISQRDIISRKKQARKTRKKKRKKKYIKG